MATSVDTQLVQSITPQIDSIFATDYARGSRIMLALESIGTRFDASSREYYILRQLYLHMASHTAQKASEPTTSTVEMSNPTIQ